MRALPLLLLLACKDDAGSTCSPDSEGAFPTWSNFGQPFVDTYCQSCHASDSPNRFGAPESITFDTEEQTLALADRLRVRVLEQQSMPPGGGVLEEDLVELDEYLACIPESP